jgi:glycosyltransferase involved in cell wall biosynthesis
MRAGLPVVCSGWRGLAELVGHGLATDDPTVRAAILRRLLDDPGLRRSLGDAARARVLDVHLRGSVHPVGHTPAGQ